MVAVTTAAAQAPNARRSSLEGNKDVVGRYFSLVEKADIAGLTAIVSPDYIEHAAYAADGRAALFKRVVENAANAEGSSLRRERGELVRMIAERDQVWTFSRVDAAGAIIGRIDMFRLEADRIVEHWAVQEKVNLERTNANDQWAMGKGPQQFEEQPKRVSRIAPADELERNKHVARLFFQYAEATDMAERRKLLAIATPAYVQHNARGADGIQAFTTRPNPLPHHMNVRMLAEGDWVWSLNVPGFAQGARDGFEQVNFNQWRLEGGKLAEHWGIYERVPAERPNTNDFLGYGRTHTRDFSR
jgi:predicted SnoaL-like aldol condensation-catalyzing enzyme